MSANRPIYEPSADAGWANVPLFYDGILQETHVIPECDLRKHIMGPGCWCEPVTDDYMFVHNSADQRELYERGDRVPN